MSAPPDVAALVPVKSLARAKSRLARELSAADRGAATLSMLRRVLGQLAGSRAVSVWAVVSRDDEVLELARQLGGTALLEAAAGLNVAIEQGREWAASLNARAMLVVPSDVPFLRGQDLEELCALLPGDGVVIAPSKDGGTNALLLRPPAAIPFRFGKLSSARHREEAEQRGLTVRIFERESVSFDVDEPADYYHYLDMSGQAGPSGGAAVASVSPMEGGL